MSTVLVSASIMLARRCIVVVGIGVLITAVAIWLVSITHDAEVAYCERNLTGVSTKLSAAWMWRHIK